MKIISREKCNPEEKRIGLLEVTDLFSKCLDLTATYIVTEINGSVVKYLGLNNRILDSSHPSEIVIHLQGELAVWRK